MLPVIFTIKVTTIIVGKSSFIIPKYSTSLRYLRKKYITINMNVRSISIRKVNPKNPAEKSISIKIKHNVSMMSAIVDIAGYTMLSGSKPYLNEKNDTNRVNGETNIIDTFMVAIKIVTILRISSIGAIQKKLLIIETKPPIIKLPCKVNVIVADNSI
jgi:hypothetical protein